VRAPKRTPKGQTGQWKESPLFVPQQSEEGYDGGVQEFATVRDAKEFLVRRIGTEADRRGIALSEIEKKMLYFSETGWTLPDMADVNASFDRDCNQGRYEAKIARLIRHIRASDKKGHEPGLHIWDDAVRKLRDEDHYLLVMIDQATGPEFSWGHVARLGAMVLIGTGVLLAAIWFFMFR